MFPSSLPKRYVSAWKCHSSNLPSGFSLPAFYWFQLILTTSLLFPSPFLYVIYLNSVLYFILVQSYTWRSTLRKALQFLPTFYIYVVTLHIKKVSLKLFLNSEFGKLISRDQLSMSSSWELCFNHFQSESNSRF